MTVGDLVVVEQILGFISCSGCGTIKKLSSRSPGCLESVSKEIKEMVTRRPPSPVLDRLGAPQQRHPQGEQLEEPGSSPEEHTS